MKIIAIAGKAQTGKGVVTDIVKHSLMMQGHQVATIPAYLSIINELFMDLRFENVMYHEFLFGKELIRKELQDIGDEINVRSSVLTETLKCLPLNLKDKYNYLLIDSWRCADSHSTLVNYCRQLLLPDPHLIIINSDRDGIKGSGLEKHHTEGDINNWPPSFISTVVNNKSTTYADLVQKIEHLVATHIT